MDQFFDRIGTCLEDEPPFCAVACPFHWDIRDFIGKLQRKNFSAAFRAYRNAVAFPRLVSALCPAPCKAACPLSHTDNGGGAVEMRLLEAAAMEHTRNTDPTAYNVPKKEGTIAIVGAGPSGLACMVRLAERGYSVTVYEKNGQIGGHLLALEDSEIYLQDIESQSRHVTYTLRLEQEVHDLSTLDADAIYIAAGKDAQALLNQAEGAINGFVGGGINGKNTVEAIADGLDAANRIEMYLKTKNADTGKKTMTTAITMEAGMIHQRPPVVPQSGTGYSKEEALEEAERCLQCACIHCKAHCDLIQYFRKMPRVMGEEVRVTGQEGLKGEITVATRMIGSCNQCGICTDVCPEDIDTCGLYFNSRRALHEKGSYPWVFNEFFLADMESAGSEAAAMVAAGESDAPDTPDTPGATDTPGASDTPEKYAFFPGCQLGASDPTYVTKSYAWLRKAYPGTGMLLKCCAAPAAWSGDEALHTKMVKALKADWIALGQPKLVFACTTCYRMFETWLPEIPRIFLYQLLAEAGDVLPETGVLPGTKDEQTWSVFDPCSSRTEPELQKTIRTLAAKAGCALEPLADELAFARCCSYGGHVSIANPEYRDDVVNKRISQSENPYVAYCSNCRDIFAQSGKPTVHILDLLFGINDVGREAPTFSQRRRNRFALKKELMETYWPEGNYQQPIDSEGINGYADIKIDDGLKAKLSADYILEKDAVETLRYVEENNRTVQDGKTGHLFGHRKVGHSTCWVEYVRDADGYRLISAYAHRMSVEPQCDRQWPIGANRCGRGPNQYD